MKETSQEASDWNLGLGCLALLATLALSLPGVQAVQADDNVPDVAAVIAESGPSCDTESAAYPSVTHVTLRRPEGSGPLPVALNGRGYGYGDAIRGPVGGLGKPPIAFKNIRQILANFRISADPTTTLSLV